MSINTLHDKTVNRTGMERDCLELVNVLSKTLKARLILNVRELFPPERPEMRQTAVLPLLVNENWEKTEVKGAHTEKQEVKLLLFTGDMIL